MKTIAIIHGWSEGRWHIKELVKELEKLELKVIKDVEKADIIIAHSLGTLLVPEETAAKLIVLIGVPLWPGKGIIKGLIENIKYDAHTKVGIKKRLQWYTLATLYALRKFPRDYRVIRRMAKAYLRLPTATTRKKIILIRNEMDVFTHPDIQELLLESKNYHFHSLPGGHDDWWQNPRKYIELIRKEIH